MRDAKSMPEHDICILDAFVTVLLDPFRESQRRLPRGLGDVAACRVELVVLVWGRGSVSQITQEWMKEGQLTSRDVDGVSCKSGSLPY